MALSEISRGIRLLMGQIQRCHPTVNQNGRFYIVYIVFKLSVNI